MPMISSPPFGNRPIGSTGAAYFSKTSSAYRTASLMPSPPGIPSRLTGAPDRLSSFNNSRNAEKIIPGRSKTSALRRGGCRPPERSSTSYANRFKSELFPMPDGPEIITACPCSSACERMVRRRLSSSCLPENSSGGDGAYETLPACCCISSMVLSRDFSVDSINTIPSK